MTENMKFGLVENNLLN